MSEPDDDALTWDGDERLRAPVGPAPKLVDDRAEPGARSPASGGAFALLAFGVLGGVAVLETLFWIRAVLELQIAASVGSAAGSAVTVAAFAANVAGRVLAVAAPLIWFGVVTARVRVPSRRLAWLALGALLLVPWPAVLAAAS